MAGELTTVGQAGVWIYRGGKFALWSGGKMLGWAKRKLLPRIDRAVRLEPIGEAELYRDTITIGLRFWNYLGAVDLGDADVSVFCLHGDVTQRVRLPRLTTEDGQFDLRVGLGPNMWHNIRHTVPLNGKLDARCVIDALAVQPWGHPWRTELALKVWRRELGHGDPGTTT